MKQLIALLLSAFLVISMAACANNTENTGNPSAPSDPTASNPTETIKEDKMLNILFLGNSLMYYNDMPSLFTRIALASGKRVNVKSVTKGSATISDFADASTEVGAKALTLLKSQDWDIVVIEPSRRISPFENTVKEAELASAKAIQQLAREAGGEVLLYSVWGNNTGTVAEYRALAPISTTKVATHPMDRQSHTQFMHEVNLEFASALGGVKVALAGYAIENCIAQHDYNLYDSDKVHPSPIGSHLAAAVIYATIFGENVDTIPYSIANPPADGDLESIANKTVLEGLSPQLPDNKDDQSFKLLIVGSNLMDDHACAKVVEKLALEIDGKKVTSKYVNSSTFVINNLTNANNDLGLRAALNSGQWDAIIIQISRRCTKSSADVEASELAALQSIMPLLKAETDNIYLFTLNSSANPAIFTTTGGDPGYTKTGGKESYTAAEGSAYFKSLADKWAAEFSIGVINYGQAYLESPSTDSIALGYLQGCMIYRALFEKALPDNITETNGNSAQTAKTLRQIAEHYA